MVHEVQLAMPSPKNPALQKQVPTSVLPTGPLAFAAHALQLEEPVIPWYLPAGQLVQVTAPRASAYFPASQDVQFALLNALLLNLPAIQGLQLFVASPENPALQKHRLSCVLGGEVAFVAHALHVCDVVSSLNVPGGQGRECFAARVTPVGTATLQPR